MASLHYTPEVARQVNRQINAELQAAHTYRCLSAHFALPSVAFPGFAAYFARAVAEETGHAQAFVDYQNSRGYAVEIGDLKGHTGATDPLYALQNIVLPLEHAVNDSLLALHEAGDEATKIFVEKFLEEQVKAIADLVTLITQVERVAEDATGLWLLDGKLLAQ